MFHFCYLDESGCTGFLPAADSPIQPVFVIAGLIISADSDRLTFLTGNQGSKFSREPLPAADSPIQPGNLHLIAAGLIISADSDRLTRITRDSFPLGGRCLSSRLSPRPPQLSFAARALWRAAEENPIPIQGREWKISRRNLRQQFRRTTGRTPVSAAAQRIAAAQVYSHKTLQNPLKRGS